MSKPNIEMAEAETLPATDHESGLVTSDPEQFQVALENENRSREMLKQYIKSSLKDGEDYGSIMIKGKKSKPCLFKPGAEKFCNLLSLKAEFTIDQETLSCMPEKTKENGVFAFKCILSSRKNNAFVAEGRGCCTIAEKYGQENNALKIAKKRALVDAVLLLGLSDSFTQDIEEMEMDHVPVTKTVQQPKTTPTATRTGKDITEMVRQLRVQFTEVYNQYCKTNVPTEKETAFIAKLDLATPEQLKRGIAHYSKVAK